MDYKNDQFKTYFSHEGEQGSKNLLLEGGARLGPGWFS